MSRLVLAAILAAAAVLVLPAGARADLNVVHQSTAATTPGGGGFVAPGDHISIFEAVRNADSIQAYSGLSATVSADDPAQATVTVPTSAYDDMSVLSTKQNLTAFEADLAASLDCGRSVRFTMELVTADDSTTIPFEVPTGIADTPVTRSGTGTDIAVAATGYVKDVAVRVADPSADLDYALHAPDGTTVDLDEVPGQPGAFAGDFDALDGHQTQGTWRLETGGPDVGDWSLQLAPATCVRAPRAVIAATPLIAQPGQTVTFDAAGSSVPSGTIAEYRWDLDGGTDFEESTADATIDHVYATSGTYTARVRVEEDGDESIAQVEVEVTEPPAAALDATPASPLTGQQVTLDASGSDDVDGTIERYDWDFDGDGDFDATTTLPTTTTSYALPGARTVRVRVVDNQGATAIATDTVDAQNRPPTAALADPGAVGTGREVILDASGSSDADDGIATYAWDLDADPDFEVTGTSVTRPHTFAVAGAIAIRVRVTDASGAQATAGRTVTVTEPPTAALTAGPNPARPGRTVTFDASGSDDPDGSIDGYEWDLDGNGTFEVSGPAATAARSFAVGTYAARVRVTDDLGIQTTSAPLSLQVRNLPPVAAVALSQPVSATQVARFDASGSTDPDGDPLDAYHWDLDGNGSFETATGTSPLASRAYPNAGTITVQVRVTDSDGGTDVKPLVFTVGPAPADGGSGGSGGAGGAGTGGSGGSGAGGSGAEATFFVDTVTGAGPGGAGGAPGLGAGDSGGATPGGATAGGAAPRSTLRASLLGAAIQATYLARTRGLSVLCRTDRAATCTVTATLAPAVARRLRVRTRSGTRPVVIGRATGSASAGADARLVVRLGPVAKRRLRGADRVLVTLRGSVRSAGGQRVAIARTVLLRRR